MKRKKKKKLILWLSTRSTPLLLDTKMGLEHFLISCVREVVDKQQEGVVCFLSYTLHSSDVDDLLEQTP